MKFIRCAALPFSLLSRPALAIGAIAADSGHGTSAPGSKATAQAEEALATPTPQPRYANARALGIRTARC